MFPNTRPHLASLGLSARFWRLAVLLTLGVVVLSTLLVGPTKDRKASAALPTTPAGWTLAWSDDFTGAANSAITNGKWVYDTGTGYAGGPANWGTGEIASHSSTTSNVYHDGAGNLVIKAIHVGTNPMTGWTSGRIRSNNTSFMPDAGGIMRVEGRIQLPSVTNAQGYWPAFWMLGVNYFPNFTWPSVGEIDILENVNGQNRVFGTLHCGVSPGGPCNEKTGRTNSREGFSSTLQSAFHIYAVEWDRSVTPNQLRWYVDGFHYFTISQTELDAGTWTNITNHGYFIILNLAIGGEFPGAPTSSTSSGGMMKIDYVAVYKRGGTAPPPSSCSGTGFTCGVVNVSTTQSRLWFKPSTSSTNVIAHYTVTGQTQQNVYMTWNGTAARWEYTFNLSAGQNVRYYFTDIKSTGQTGTATFSYTK